MTHEFLPSPFRHPLSSDLVERVRALRISLADMHDMSEEKWLEGFERDASPAREIEWWEKLTAAFEAFVAHYSLEPDRRPAAFNLACALAMGLNGTALADALERLPERSSETMQRYLCIQWG